MSYSSLYVIGKDHLGTEEYRYKNSWWFSPIIWDALTEKYTIPDPVYAMWGLKKSIIGPHGHEVWREVNNAVNNCDCIEDRICWELTNQQIFQTKDQKLVADCIFEFVRKNSEKFPILQQQHISDRFGEIASHIRILDKDAQPYFVFKNTSVDDAVECWFEKYSEETDEYMEAKISDRKDFVAEIVAIENGAVEKLVPNTKWNWKANEENVFLTEESEENDD